jgi:mannose-6-phosphate isomerase-like protein (cupin superfamily)
MLSPICLKTALDAPVFRIGADDTNYFVLLFDQEGEGFETVAVVEIFTVGGATPPNMHSRAHEMFYVLHGEGVAHCEGASVALGRGSAMLLRPGSEHVVENTGLGKLYTLTIMVPNEGFAELIRAGIPMRLDDEDRAVLGAL